MSEAQREITKRLAEAGMTLDDLKAWVAGSYKLRLNPLPILRGFLGGTCRVIFVTTSQEAAASHFQEPILFVHKEQEQIKLEVVV